MKKIAIVSLMCMAITACKTQDASGVLKEYYTYSNALVKGDTTHADYLKTHLSKSATHTVEKIPFLFEYSLLALTKNGTLENMDILKTEEISKDSVIVHVVLHYSDGSQDTTLQSLVKEADLWKVSLSKGK